MKTLLVTSLILIALFLFINPTLADICTDVEQKTGLYLNEAECYVLKRIEKGELAHFKENQSWPYGNYLSQFIKIEDRTLSAGFLTALRNEGIN
ncbi:MAG: hypothetical protein GY786_05470 [Proteobacteria bacterium]|nr:hypothetical protein [Pseudomonadota bacterium]